MDIETRVLRKKLSKLSVREANTCVDDIFGVFAQSKLVSDMFTVRKVVRSPLGPDLLASDKEDFSLFTGKIVWVG